MRKALAKTRRNMAIIAGLSLILMALIAGYTYVYAFQSLSIPGDSVTTLNNLNESPYLLRLIIFSFLIIFVLDVIVAWATYYFFAHGCRGIRPRFLVAFKGWQRTTTSFSESSFLFCLEIQA